ncbi:MAG: tRNA (adenosine(37)-N6)-dimethylallyltransferase MiaA [Candidatus Pacebacteria bacterium]|nr:tRNA (adenosine(37)-N6)-dimethylallyltransferase MiaA [Candidatus Paceibacterota bacterium]MDD3072095.1 tRNA (adenosine(37)-N6)-dimethylallyltransferase MiaA [Candidatus Paceibacterota bacterium]MDD3728840.1 tRNA (adenosine(37)-N6)-dimethylallyltransferase MiaA [Candidatus Paceibacterota bacterium]MDD4201301.1 tRNA (adenosine(37)-N6)-dimethylallyltransferase MiaA [Candidatus Paceibacterota bacterium]MDD4467400.1 tRNA (adenosine(37)-N6)-dimethylallyltransferase MiaA [Candidatus Paceibacterota
MGTYWKNKIIAIVGPNASGKTSLSIGICLYLNSKKIKKHFNIKGAEIISADSRQVYKGLDIGSGKIKKKETKGIPHHLIDIVSPKKIFTVADYKKKAIKKIENLHKENKIPIIVGGTGFYVDAIIKNTTIPEVMPDWKLRKKLEQKTKKELFLMLEKKDKRRAKEIDKNNKRRIIRALEIIESTGKRIPKKENNPLFDSLIFGIKKSQEKQKILIAKRLKKRLREGMVKEVENLHKKGISWKRLEDLGLEYRYIAYYLQGKMPYDEMIEKLQKEIEHFAKRQMTWFKRNKEIIWIEGLKEAKKNLEKI